MTASLCDSKHVVIKLPLTQRRQLTSVTLLTVHQPFLSFSQALTAKHKHYTQEDGVINQNSKMSSHVL